MEKILYYSKAELIDYEDSAKYAHVLTQYFNYVRPHGHINGIENQENVIVLYNTPHWQPTEIADVVHIARIPSDIIFYDKKVSAMFEPQHQWVEVRLNGKHAGYYCKDINVLVATDWTHMYSKENEEIVKEILQAVGACKIRTKKQKITVTVGSDPEFELIDVNTNRIICAGEHFSGTDPDIEIGVDGAGNQVELRPKPGDIRQHVQHVRSLVRKFSELGCFDLSTKGDVYPLGGHIHIGGVQPTEDVLELLDDFLGRHVVDLSGSARGSYKSLGAYEKKSYGFEYRTCPTAIFHNAKILKICLKIVKNLLEKLVNKGTITYYYPVKAEDYYQHARLTENEYKYFRWFIENYRSKLANQTLLGAWKVRRKKPKPTWKLTISQNDTFSDQIRQALFAIPERFRLRKDIYVFGLHEKRGNVYTFPTRLGTRITEFDPCISANTVKIGIAYWVRVSEDERIIGQLIKDLTKYLRQNKAIAYKRKKERTS